MSGIEYCPKINGYIDVDECNKCEHLGLSRWSMKPVCRYGPREAHPGDRTCNLCGHAQFRGDGKGGVEICPSEIRQAIESGRDSKGCRLMATKVTIATNGPVDPQAIPAYAINNLAGPLIQKVAKYSEDPKIQAAFEQ